MKIGFNSPFSDISQLLKAPDRASREKRENFTKLLSEVSPANKKPFNISKITPYKPHLERLQRGQMEARAQLNFDQPALKTADLTRHQSASLIPSHRELPSLSEKSSTEKPVNSVEPLVKKPTLLEVRRTPSAEQLAAKSLTERQRIVQNIVAEKGAKLGIDPALSMAVVSAESSFDPQAVSRDGHYSKGLFQLLDRTGKEQLQRAGIDAPYDPHDPELSAELGIRYLRQLHNIFSSHTRLPGNLFTTPAANSSCLEKLALAAYNAGEGRVAAAQRSSQAAGKDPSHYDNVEQYLPESTQEYVRRVLNARRHFETSFIG